MNNEKKMILIDKSENILYLICLTQPTRIQIGWHRLTFFNTTSLFNLQSQLHLIIDPNKMLCSF